MFLTTTLDFQTVMILVWIGVIILTAVIEANTMDLSSIWFSVGALFAMIVTLFKVGLIWQIVIFIVASVALLLTVRPIIKKNARGKEIKTNADSLVGKIAICTTAIKDTDRGEVKIEGKIWTAISNETIEVGDKVIVLSIKGVKLVVRKQ